MRLEECRKEDLQLARDWSLPIQPDPESFWNSIRRQTLDGLSCSYPCIECRCTSQFRAIWTIPPNRWRHDPMKQGLFEARYRAPSIFGQLDGRLEGRPRSDALISAGRLFLWSNLEFSHSVRSAFYQERNDSSKYNHSQFFMLKGEEIYSGGFHHTPAQTLTRTLLWIYTHEVGPLD